MTFLEMLFETTTTNFFVMTSRGRFFKLLMLKIVSLHNLFPPILSLYYQLESNAKLWVLDIQPLDLLFSKE